MWGGAGGENQRTPHHPHPHLRVEPKLRETEAQVGGNPCVQIVGG